MRILLFVFLFLSTSCEVRQVRRFTGSKMGMSYSVLIGDPLIKNDIAIILDQSFKEIDTIYNKWNPDSELSLLNKLPSEKKTVSEKLANFLKLTNEIVQLSRGKFDPTIEPLQKLWKRYLERGLIPPIEEVKEMKQFVGWSKIHCKDRIFWKENSGIELDLSGIAKGFCVDLIVENLQKAGYRNLFVEWGGEIRALGNHPEGRFWSVFIRSPQNSAEAVDRVELRDMAIATSGDYQQYWKVEDKIYFHIIDPETLHPLEVSEHSLASVSVMAETCAFADALATAAMLFGTVTEAEKWLKEVKNRYPISYWIVSRTSKATDST